MKWLMLVWSLNWAVWNDGELIEHEMNIRTQPTAEECTYYLGGLVAGVLQESDVIKVIKPLYYDSDSDGDGWMVILGEVGSKDTMIVLCYDESTRPEGR